jgi:hypothetical protein
MCNTLCKHSVIAGVDGKNVIRCTLTDAEQMKQCPEIKKPVPKKSTLDHCFVSMALVGEIGLEISKMFQRRAIPPEIAGGILSKVVKDLEKIYGFKVELTDEIDTESKP